MASGSAAPSRVATRNSGSLSDTRERGGTLRVRKTEPPITLPAKSMGDVNNGTHQVNLTIPNVTVGPNNTVAFVYTIVNSGFNANSVEQALQKIVNQGAEKGAGAGSTALCGLVTDNPAVATTCGTVGTSAATWIMGKLDSILFANCDGTVAAATHGFTGGVIIRTAAGGRPKEDILGDLDAFHKIWTEMRQRNESSRAPAVLFQEPGQLGFLLVQPNLGANLLQLRTDPQERLPLLAGLHQSGLFFLQDLLSALKEIDLLLQAVAVR